MASVAAGAGQSLFAAVAFSGASYLFRFIEGGHSSAEEIKRHDIATEKARKAQELFAELETRRRNRLAQSDRNLGIARNTISDTNSALSEYRLTRELQESKEGGSDDMVSAAGGNYLDFDGKRFTREPQLSDFYKPSEKMKKYVLAFTVLMGVGVGLLIYLFLF